MKIVKNQGKNNVILHFFQSKTIEIKSHLRNHM